MLFENIIESAQTEWAAQIVFVPKKDGIPRFWKTYSKLNAITERDPYPIPRMHEYIDLLGKETVFSTLGAKSSYWQIEIKDADKDRTVFKSHCGLYCFGRIPFWFTKCPRNIPTIHGLDPFKSEMAICTCIAGRNRDLLARHQNNIPNTFAKFICSNTTLGPRLSSKSASF